MHQLNIVADMPLTQAYVVITNATGQQILSKKIEAGDGFANTITINELPAGIYTVTLITNEKQHTARFIKQ